MQTIHKHYVRRQCHVLVHFHKITWDLHIINLNMLWFSSSCFSPDVSKVTTIYVVSIVYILYSDRTVG